MHLDIHSMMVVATVVPLQQKEARLCRITRRLLIAMTYCINILNGRPCIINKTLPLSTYHAQIEAINFLIAQAN